jgi:hypothetical protein
MPPPHARPPPLAARAPAERGPGHAAPIPTLWLHCAYEIFFLLAPTKKGSNRTTWEHHPLGCPSDFVPHGQCRRERATRDVDTTAEHRVCVIFGRGGQTSDSDLLFLDQGRWLDRRRHSGSIGAMNGPHIACSGPTARAGASPGVSLDRLPGLQAFRPALTGLHAFLSPRRTCGCSSLPGAAALGAGRALNSGALARLDLLSFVLGTAGVVLTPNFAYIAAQGTHGRSSAHQQATACHARRRPLRAMRQRRQRRRCCSQPAEISCWRCMRRLARWGLATLANGRHSSTQRAAARLAPWEPRHCQQQRRCGSSTTAWSTRTATIARHSGRRAVAPAAAARQATKRGRPLQSGVHPTRLPQPLSRSTAAVPAAAARAAAVVAAAGRCPRARSATACGGGQRLSRRPPARRPGAKQQHQQQQRHR